MQADSLARIASHQHVSSEERCLPAWPAMLAKHTLRNWAWCVVRPQPDIPHLIAFPAEARRLQQEQRPAAAPPEDGAAVLPLVDAQLNLSFVSFHVLSLYDPSHTGGAAGKKQLSESGLRIHGKRDLLKRQLLELGALFVGLQETRLVTDCISPDADFIMLQASAEPTGQLGVALWINRVQPYCRQGGRSFMLAQEHAHVVDASPRHLLVQLHAPFLDLTLLVAHGPYEGSRNAEPSPFWSDMSCKLSLKGISKDVVVLTDSNAHVGSVVTEAISDCGAETENLVGEVFHAFLLRHSLCAPSTFEDTHSGPHATWHGAHGRSHRVDFVVVPASWRCEVRSRVLISFESLQSRQDHAPVYLTCCLQPKARPPAYTQAPRRLAMRPGDRWTPTHTVNYLQQIQHSSRLTWGLDVDSHFQQLVLRVRQAFQAQQEPQVAAVRGPYLSQASWDLAQRRKSLRSYPADEDVALLRLYKLRGFAAFWLTWTGMSASAAALARLQQSLRCLRFGIASAACQLGRSGAEIRRHVRRDRLEYLHSLQQNICLHDFRDPRRLYAAVRKAFPALRPSRRSSFAPLPQVRLEDGSLAVTHVQRCERWHSYFSGLEAGDTVSDVEYAAAFARQQVQPAGSFAFDIWAVPTFREVEEVLSPHLASFKHELQAGSLPGVGTDTLLLLARAAQGIGKAQRRRTALLFFDIRAAYYQLLRQLATDIHEDDTELLRLFHRMNVPAALAGHVGRHCCGGQSTPRRHCSGPFPRLLVPARRPYGHSLDSARH